MSPLYISDLDGTLLQPDATLSPYSRDELNRLISEGLLFTVASARSIISMRELLAGLELKLPAINLNGALLSDLKTGHHHVVNALPAATSAHVYELILKAGLLPFVSTTNGARDRLYYQSIKNAGMQWYLDDRLKARDTRLSQLDELHRALDEQVLTFTVISCDEKRLRMLQRTLEEEHAQTLQMYLFANSYSTADDTWLTIADVRATKDRGIGLLAAHCSLSLDKLTVFGDNDNDVEMFGMAKNAVAVANAIPSVRNLATETIGANSEDSVVRYLAEKHEQAKGFV